MLVLTSMWRPTFSRWAGIGCVYQIQEILKNLCVYQIQEIGCVYQIQEILKNLNQLRPFDRTCLPD